MRPITVRFFAAAADAAGTSETTLEIPENAQLAEALDLLERRFPSLASIRPHCTVFINDAHTENQDLSDARTLDILPPFAGG